MNKESIWRWGKRACGCIVDSLNNGGKRHSRRARREVQSGLGRVQMPCWNPHAVHVTLRLDFACQKPPFVDHPHCRAMDRVGVDLTGDDVAEDGEQALDTGSAVHPTQRYDHTVGRHGWGRTEASRPAMFRGNFVAGTKVKLRPEQIETCPPLIPCPVCRGLSFSPVIKQPGMFASSSLAYFF